MRYGVFSPDVVKEATDDHDVTMDKFEAASRGVLCVLYDDTDAQSVLTVQARERGDESIQSLEAAASKATRAGDSITVPDLAGMPVSKVAREEVTVSGGVQVKYHVAVATEQNYIYLIYTPPASKRESVDSVLRALVEDVDDNLAAALEQSNSAEMTNSSEPASRPTNEGADVGVVPSASTLSSRLG